MQPHKDPLVILDEIVPNYRVERMIVDRGSSVNVLYMVTFLRMGLVKENLSFCTEAIYGFTNAATPVVSIIDLKTSIGFMKGRISRTC